MPELTSDQYAALKNDIGTNGVMVPITVDQHGRVLDGHNRQAIADELGVPCPRTVQEVADDDQAHDLAVTLNCARRHLSQEQKRGLIRAELIRRPSDSDRTIARRVGCSPSTVGADRAEWRAEAERRVQETRELLDGIREQLTMRAMVEHRSGGSWQSVGDVMERVLWGQSCEQWDDGGWAPDIDLFTGVFVPIFGELFDAIRAYDCSTSCPTCTPESRSWRDEYPGQVYRHSDPPVQVSNLDSQSAAQGCSA